MDDWMTGLLGEWVEERKKIQKEILHLEIWKVISHS